MKFVVCFFLLFFFIAASTTESRPFLQEKRQFFATENGLPTNNVVSICAFDSATIYASSAAGLYYLSGDAWSVQPGFADAKILALAKSSDHVQVLYESSQKTFLAILRDNKMVNRAELSRNKLPGARLFQANYVCINNDLYRFDPAAKEIKLERLLLTTFTINDLAAAPDGAVWMAGDVGLFKYYPGQKTVLPTFPADTTKSWALTNVSGLTFDARGRLWFASSQGVGVYDGAVWKLFTGADGLPYNGFTCAAAGGDGAVWFGTDKGAIRFDGENWQYRQGLRWLPDDFVQDISVAENGDAYIATPKGISRIERVPMRLAEKAKFYEDDIDRYHRRTPFEFVAEVRLDKPGDKSAFRQQDTDNDGLWTSMYGAGECFAYAATENPLAKKRANKVFNALEFLGKVTQGGSHPAPMGFVARTILPTGGPNPNDGRINSDIKKKAEEDSLWKVIVPRWPLSADGKWYWKTDTSSDELDGHYFFYGLYYDLVAETMLEKNRVRFHVAALTDHLLAHNFQLVDHDGKPTRWGRFNPHELNHDRNWVFDRNLNSLSMLAYLVTAAHITGEIKYVKYAEFLVENHGYLQNAQTPKTQRGIGTGNQSDDEMALMMLYNFIKYAPHAEWRDRLALACWTYGRLELPEMNPLFNFIYAASCKGRSFADAWGKWQLDPTGRWQEDAIETLQRFPLDRFDWAHDNSQRIDIIKIDERQRHFDEGNYDNRGLRVNGKVIPVDERHFNHWNHDPYALTSGGDGRTLADGAVFLLPYYMGVYYGYIKE